VLHQIAEEALEGAGHGLLRRGEGDGDGKGVEAGDRHGLRLEDRDGRGGDGDREGLAEEREESPLAPFTPPPAVLGDPSPASGVSLSSAAADPTAQALAELRAMADRMVTSVKLGRRGDGHALDMKLSLGRRGRVGVTLALSNDDLEITLDPETVSRADALSLAAAVERELGVRVGVD
jgi:hypothetical protein